jgi:Dolichyl-phosphate-mannose-protein mannosyltransferase
VDRAGAKVRGSLLPVLLFAFGMEYALRSSLAGARGAGLTKGAMFYVPLYVEALRARPRLVFWLAALAQAALWLAVPMLFYAAPPGDLAHLLAVAHDPPLRPDIGPPLAYWVADLAFRAAGMPGIYLLSQACVVAAFWCVFALGRALVGPTQAVIAVLLMVGIFTFGVPTPEFGPPILAMPFWAASVLFYWRAVAEKRSLYWYAFAAAAAGLLVSTTYALVFVALLLLFTVSSRRARAAAQTYAAWIAWAAVAGMLYVHVDVLHQSGFTLMPTIERLRLAGAAAGNAEAWLKLIGVLVLAHAGLILLVALAFGWPRTGAARAPAITRPPLPPSTLIFVRAFAIGPVLLTTIIVVIAGFRLPIADAAPLLLLSGLAVVVFAGNTIELHHQRLLGLAWLALLAAPAVLMPVAIVVLPWATGTELKVAQPATAMGTFFADSFARRTGRPLAIVGGDRHIAALVAVGAPSWPNVYFDTNPAPRSRITAEAVRRNGAVIVWASPDTNPAPPPDIKARFPDLVPEVPHAFARPVRGRLPPLLVGWGVIRPADASSESGQTGQ